MKNIIKILTVFFVAAFVAGCSPAETAIEPNFPEKTSHVINLAAGDDNTVQLSISPNQDWTVSIPTSASDYWAIVRGSRNVLTVGGQAGDHVVQIICLASEQDLEEHSVEVSMTMGGRSSVIADITLLSGDPVLNIRPAITASTDGHEYFVEADANSAFAYTYPENAPAPGTPIEMIWSASRNGYLAYIQVESNFNWSLEAGQLDISRVGNSNTDASFTELEIFCRSLNYPSTADRTDTFALTSSVVDYQRNTISMSVPPFEPLLEIRVPQYDGEERNYVIPTEENSYEDYPYNWLYTADAIAENSVIQLNWRPSATATALDSYILVKSNFTPGFTSVPSWLTVGTATLQEETTTDFELETVYRISVESDNLTLEGAEGEISVGLGDFAQKFNVKYPDITDLFYIVNPPTFSFAADGTYEPSSELGMSTATNAVVNITSSGDLEIMEFVLSGGSYILDDAQNGWISHSYSWNGGSASMIQENGLTVTVSANEGSYRRGMVMAFPKSVYRRLPSDISEIFDENSQLKEEYADYLVAYVTQTGATLDTGSISVVEGEYWAVQMARFDVLDSDPTGSGFTSCYKLTYAMPVESADVPVGSAYLLLSSEVPVASFRVVNMDGSAYSGTPWVNFVTTSDGYYITMSPGTGETPEDVCIILTNGNGGDFAIIQCCYDPEAQISDISLRVSGTLPEGFTFTQLSLNDPLVAGQGLGAESYWLLTYSGEADASVTIEGFPAEVGSAFASMNASSWLSIGQYNTTRSSCPIYFTLSTKVEGSVNSGMIYFYESGDTGQTPVVIICQLNN